MEVHDPMTKCECAAPSTPGELWFATRKSRAEPAVGNLGSSTLCVLAWALALLGEACRQCALQQPASPGDGPRRQRQEVVQRAIAWIEENASSENLSVEQMADALHMSRSSLHRKIVDQAGCSPGELIRQIRMQLGKQLLLAGSDNVSEVAYSVGYSSLSSFSRAYRQYYGIAPSAEYLPATRMRPATVGQATATGWISLDLRL